jgi:hypothetical protein
MGWSASTPVTYRIYLWRDRRVPNCRSAPSRTHRSTIEVPTIAARDRSFPA